MKLIDLFESTNDELLETKVFDMFDQNQKHQLSENLNSKSNDSTPFQNQ